MLPPGTRVIAAVSGGADSVALLHILRDIAPEALVGVAHFNHHLRGEESDADERFVAELAKGFHLPFHRKCAELGSGNLEQNARRARQDFFRHLILTRATDSIALGHTLDDQAETVLFRILRGSGLSGLAGILPVTAEGVIRPLLEVRRQAIRAYLEDRGIPWREDSSNRSLQFARNRIRQSLLPDLQRTWNPRIAEALAHLGDVAYEEEVWWAGEVARHEHLLLPGPGSVEIFTPSLASLPPALVRRLLRHAIRLSKGDLRGIDYSHVQQLVALSGPAHASARRTLPGVTAVRSFDWLLVRVPRQSPAAASLSIPTPGVYPWPPAKPMIKLEINADVHNPNPCDTLDLELRGWRAGDQYRPRGHGRSAKLKELFQKARIPSWRRASWPIITGKGKILWAKEFGHAAEGSGLSIREIPISSESFNPKPTS
jgi:tRNA(Ile)-lysidine synthase